MIFHCLVNSQKSGSKRVLQTIGLSSIYTLSKDDVQAGVILLISNSLLHLGHDEEKASSHCIAKRADYVSQQEKANSR